MKKISKAWKILIDKNYLFLYIRKNTEIIISSSFKNINFANNKLEINANYFKNISANRLAEVIYHSVMIECHNEFSGLLK